MRVFWIGKVYLWDVNVDQRIMEVKILCQYALNVFHLLLTLQPSLSCCSPGAAVSVDCINRLPWCWSEDRTNRGVKSETGICILPACSLQVITVGCVTEGYSPSVSPLQITVTALSSYCCRPTWPMRPLLLHSSSWFPYSLTIALQIFPWLESLQTIPVCMASTSWLGVQASGLLQQGKMNVVLHKMDIGVAASVSVISQELPHPDQKAQYMIPFTLPWDRRMNNSDIRDRVLKAEWERESLSQDHRERKENQYQGGKRILRWAHRVNHLWKTANLSESQMKRLGIFH